MEPIENPTKEFTILHEQEIRKELDKKIEDADPKSVDDIDEAIQSYISDNEFLNESTHFHFILADLRQKKVLAKKVEWNEAPDPEEDPA